MTEHAQESDSNGDSDLEDKEIKDQDGGNVSSVETEENNWPKNQGNSDVALYYVTLVHLCFRFELLYRICSQT